jgi:dihydroorotate dehydrogenase (NAD+) catalytic subunit
MPMAATPFYDPERSYSDNYAEGPFGAFRNGEVVSALEAPTHNFCGQLVHAPFGIPAGPLVNGHFVKAALDKGFDLPMYKTVRSAAHVSHPWPNVLAVHPPGDLHPGERLVADREYVDPVCITNSFGVPSMSPDVWQPDLADAVRHAREGQCVLASFQGTLPTDHSSANTTAAYIADFAATARLMRETGVKIVEVNLSCPNEGTAAVLCFDVERSRSVCEAIRNELGDVPLLIKTAYFRDPQLLRSLITALAPFIQGVSSINTVSAEVVDARGEQALPGTGRLSSGVCGACIRWAGLEMTRRLVELREDLGATFAINGVGGVTTADDYALYRTAGADAVMSATGAMWSPYLAREVRAREASLAAVSQHKTSSEELHPA